MYKLKSDGCVAISLQITVIEEQVQLVGTGSFQNRHILIFGRANSRTKGKIIKF